MITKTLYANLISLAKDDEYSFTIKKVLQEGAYDRHEFYTYDLDNRITEVSRDSSHDVNSKTGHYDTHYKPTTSTLYNVFGEVIKSSVRINESDWADTYTYYDKGGNKKAVIDSEGYLTAYSYTTFGDVEEITEYALSAGDWDTNHFSPPLSNAKDGTVRYLYDPLGQVTSKTLKQVSFERKKNNSSSFETVLSDLTTSYAYDALGNLISTTDAKGNTSYCYYNESGQLIAKVAPKTREGRATTTYSYDALGHLVETRRWAQGALEADDAHFDLKGLLVRI